MLGTTILCITVKPVYDAILIILGPEGFLFSYVDDVYMGWVPGNVAASGLYAMIGLALSWGPRMTELKLPLGCDPDRLPLPRDGSGKPLPQVVSGFDACLGDPRQPANCNVFINEALKPRQLARLGYRCCR